MSSWSKGESVCTKNWLDVALERELRSSPRPGRCPRARGDLGDGRVRRHRRVEHPHPVELGRAGLAAERLAVAGPRAALFTSRATSVGVARAAGAARRAGSARSSRHTGRRSKGSCVRNDDIVPMPRQWARPNIRPPRAAHRSSIGSTTFAFSSAGAGEGHARVGGQGDQLVAPGLGAVRRRRILDELEDPEPRSRPSRARARRPRSRPRAARRPGGRRRCGGGGCARW